MEEDMPILAPGYRFFPTEEELIMFYLHNKLNGKRDDEFNRVIPLVHIYDFDPWQLPEISGELCHRDTEQWFFFTPRQEREARGGRPNRTTKSGYWKATGSPGYVYSSSSSSSSGCGTGNYRVIGVKKTMVFYRGKAPTGRKTKWKMNEYRAIIHGSGVGGQTSSSTYSTPMLRHEFSLCRVYVKSGCLRAFDRRPSGNIGTASTNQNVVQEVCGDGATISSYQQANPSIVVEKTSSSPDYPTSSGHNHTHDHGSSVMGEANIDDHWDITDDLNPLWEWEQLKWV